MSDDKNITENKLIEGKVPKIGPKPLFEPLVSPDTVTNIIRRLKKVPVKTPPKVDPRQKPLFPENPNNLPVPVTPGKAPQAPTPVVPQTAPLPTIPNPTKPLPKTPVAVPPKPVDALPKTEPPQTKPLPKTTTDKKAPPPPSKPPVDNTGGKGGRGRRFGGMFGFGGAQGRDLRTHITGTGVREEYISEEEKFKKFKVIYIINGSEKTNVYRYKGKDTFAKARVMRQLRERGAGSIRFMQYESADIEEGATWSPGVGWIGGASDEGVDDRGDGYRVNPKTGENERVYPNKQYGYGYKENGRRKALPRSREKIYHSVSFKQKDAAKEEGMRWDPEVKKWYHSDADRSAASKFKKLDEAYMPDATRKPVVYRAPPKRGEVVGKMKVRLIRRHQDVMPGERTATSDNTKRLRRLIRKVLKKGKLKR
jgi:hypothetical protein